MKQFQFAIAIVATIGMLNSAVADEEGTKRKRAGGAEMRERILKEFDADGDGKLSGPEREKAKAAMQERRGGAGGENRPSREEIIAKFDKDGDGKLNEAERKAAMAARQEMMKKRGADSGGGRRTPDPERMKELLKRFDKNEDGKLDEAERAAAKEAIGKMRAGRGEGKRGKDGAGTPGGEEPRRPRPDKSELLEKFDANGDGKLDETERAAAKEELKNRKKS